MANLEDQQSSQVRVVVRVRPFLPSEINAAANEVRVPCVTVVNDDRFASSTGEVTLQIKDQWSSRSECYKLDSFYDQVDDLGQIFYQEVSKVLPGIFQGFNTTIFAYGATGSGKTYTMQGTDEHPGLVPLALSTILSSCQRSGSSVEISYYEVYLDRCYDLLEPKAKEIMILEDKDRMIQLKGLSRIPVHSMEKFMEAFYCGVQRRKVAHTGLNDVSSRSHGILSVIVSNGSITGKLNLIDLAGYEDNRRTCNEGIRLQESSKINQSLFALSNVIYALNNHEPRVPYRESKLTRILQESLGGPNRALMIACLNPGSYTEAVHTVSLAARSRHIGNCAGLGLKQQTPNVKVDMEAKLQAWLESKGKVKSTQKTISSRTPFVGKTPKSISCHKRIEIRSSTKANDQGSVSRKLFDCALQTSDILNYVCQEKVMSRETTTTCELPSKSMDDVSKEIACHVGDCLKEKLDGHDFSTAEEKSLEGCTVDVNIAPETLKGDASVTYVNEHTSSNADLFFNDNSLQASSKIVVSPPITEKIKDLQRSLRKVLSPVNSHTTPVKRYASDEGVCIVLLEQKSPKAKSTAVPNSEEHPVFGTPLDKFNALSSNLKDSLAKEYLEFLNVASKEELLSLKGIGQKRADYILQLRQQSPQPLKSLSDLEKIGLSSKQVHEMFRRTARGIFA